LIQLLGKTNTKKKMLYLVPIVALANLRFREYQHLRNYGINAALRVGISHLSKKKRRTEELGSMDKADIIIATYEAIDIILRSGHPHLVRDLGTVIIDEIQMLADPERGFLLDGLISRLRIYLPHAQFIFLSATVSDPKDLATHLRTALIHYQDRPVPIERHLIMCLEEGIKLKNMLVLTREEFRKRSSFGYKGQTIIFTNSRKNTENLADYLTHNHVKSMAYHGGLTYEQRKIVEHNFIHQKIACVITTAALAAGVDFAASQVIFANLTMGIKWLTVAEFEQMAGRAGRLKKHDTGKVYLLITPGKAYTAAQTETEERMAILLLKGQIEPLLLDPDDNGSLTEILALIAMYSYSDKNDRGINMQDLSYFQTLLYNHDFDLNYLLIILKEKGLILRIRNNSEWIATPFGKAVSESFLRVDKALEIKEELQVPVIEGSPPPNMIKIARSLQPLNNIYITNRLLSEMAGKGEKRAKSNNLFSNDVLALMTADNLGKRSRLNPHVYDILIRWSEDIFNCTCKDQPYCECGKDNIEQILVEYRLAGLTLNEIMLAIEDEYEIQIFQGDLIDFFEQLIYNLLAINKIGKTIRLAPQTMLKIRDIPHIITDLISPKKNNDQTDEELIEED
jgi:helicase